MLTSVGQPKREKAAFKTSSLVTLFNCSILLLLRAQNPMATCTTE